MFSLDLFFLLIQNLIEGFSGEKAQKLRALAVLPENTVSLPKTHSRQLTKAQPWGIQHFALSYIDTHMCIYKRSLCVSCCLGLSHTHHMYTHTHK